MSMRIERDLARVRCLVIAINSLRCELARVVQEGEQPEVLDDYAEKSLAMGEDQSTLFGLSLNEMGDLIGTMAAVEKLVSMGQSPHDVAALILSNIEDSSMGRDLCLYLEGIVMDRRPDPPPAVEA